MASLLSREPVCRKEDCSPFDISTMYRLRVIALFTDTGKFRFIESSGSQIYCSSSPRQKKPLESSECFCAQNNILLREKRDDNHDDSNLQGNFQALLEFCIDSGDVKPKENLENAPRSAPYCSKMIQNETIKTVGNYASSKIIV